MSRASEGALALVIGLGGHRALRQDDAPHLEDRLQSVFSDFQRRYPNTPLVLLSSLAEGADRLGARVALANGLRVVAPLPLPPDDYSEDFHDAASRSEFSSLLGQVAEWFVVPGEPGDTRERRYARAAAYMAHRSHVIIALWDGTPTMTEAGTAALVSFALEGVPEGYREGRGVLDLEERRPVIHIVTPQSDASVALNDALAIHRLYPAGYGNAESSARAFHGIWQRVDDFNGDAARLRALPEAGSNTLLPIEESKNLPERLRALQHCCAVADALSVRFQRITYRTLNGLIVLGLVAAYAFQVDQLLKPPSRALRIISFMALGGAYLWWLQSRRSRWQIRHLDYRALAEGLRVQFFWHLAGLHGSAADHYLRKQRSELDWVRRAIRTYDLGVLPARTSATVPMIKVVLDHWVRSQRSYFARAARRNDARNRLLRYVGLAFLAATVGLALLTLLPGSAHPVLAATALVPTMWAFVQFYADKGAFAPLAKQYARMSYGFAVAEQELTKSLQAADGARAQRLLHEVGVEALAENGDWVLLYRDRPLDVPRAN